MPSIQKSFFGEDLWKAFTGLELQYQFRRSLVRATSIEESSLISGLSNANSQKYRELYRWVIDDSRPKLAISILRSPMTKLVHLQPLNGYEDSSYDCEHSFQLST